MTLHALHLEQPTAEVLACAVLQAIDDLEARAIIAEHHDPALGSVSAAEYRTDVQPLRLILGAIGDDHIPTPERAAVLWIDGTWIVQAGRPVRLHRQDDLEALLESSLDLVHHGLLDAQDALIAIHHLVATDRLHLATTTDLLDRDDDFSTTHDDTTDDDTTDDEAISIVRSTRDLQAPCLPTPKPLAAPDRELDEALTFLFGASYRRRHLSHAGTEPGLPSQAYETGYVCARKVALPGRQQRKAPARRSRGGHQRRAGIASSQGLYGPRWARHHVTLSGGTMRTSPADRPRPGFARMYERVSPGMEAEGMARLRDELLAGLSGDVIEVGAGNGMNFSHYPPEVASVVAVEPEPYLRGLAERAAERVELPVTVVAGRAENLPARDAGADHGVVSLMLCALDDQEVALGELYRAVKPGGQLRFLEHVAADSRWLGLIQRLADATVWPILTGGCRTARDPLAAIARAGFEIETVRRLRFPESRLPVPASPHVLGVARRPD